MAYITTSTALGGSASYTTPAIKSDLYDAITGTIFADQAGTLNVEQSFDGTNWDGNTTTAVTASTATIFNVTLVAPYFRLRYVNGATPQTVFRLNARTYAAGKN